MPSLGFNKNHPTAKWTAQPDQHRSNDTQEYPDLSLRAVSIAMFGYLGSFDRAKYH